MNKPKDKLGWAKAAAWVVGGVAFAVFAAHDVFTRGWAGVGEVAALAVSFVGIRAGLHFGNQYFNPTRSSLSQNSNSDSVLHKHTPK